MSALYCYLLHNWLMNTNFSGQDHRVMASQRYDTPEKLSGTDAEIIAWRQMLLGARGMSPHPTAAAAAGAEHVTSRPQVAGARA